MKSKYALPKDGGLITAGVPSDIYRRYEKLPTEIFARDSRKNKDVIHMNINTLEFSSIIFIYLLIFGKEINTPVFLVYINLYEFGIRYVKTVFTKYLFSYLESCLISEH